MAEVFDTPAKSLNYSTALIVQQGFLRQREGKPGKLLELLWAISGDWRVTWGEFRATVFGTYWGQLPATSGLLWLHNLDTGQAGESSVK